VPLARAIWIVTTALAGISVAMMLSLVFRRWAAALGATARERRRAAMEHAMLAYLDHEVTLDQARRQIGGQLDLMCDVGFRLADMIRGDARGRLLDLMERAGAADHLIRQLGRAGHRTRVLAATNLRHFGGAAVTAALDRALDGEYADLRLAAASSLAQLGAAPPLPELVARLRIGPEEHSDLLRHVFRRLVPARIPALIDLLHADVDPTAKLYALDALAQSGDYGIIDAMTALTADPSLELRAGAFRVLAALAHPAALPAVRVGLSDPAWQVRTQAAICAGRISSPELAPLLASMLDDANWWARFRAAEALLELGPEGRATLVEASRRGAGEAARTAQIVLAEQAA
jgi:HEAT repeat protein